MRNCIMYIMGMDSTKYGGIERMNVALASTLHQQGYSCVFVYESYPDSTEFTDDLTKAGGSILVCNSRRNKAVFILRLADILLRYRPLILHAHFTKARFYALPLAYLMGIRRLFFTVHGELGSVGTIKPHTFQWYRWASRKAQVITVSDCIKEQYLANWPEAHPKRVYLGVAPIEGCRETSRLELGIPCDQTMALVIANFNHIKGLDILCESIALLKEQNKLADNVHFYIVGQHEKDIRELMEMARQREIASHLHMIGISNRVALYMSAADMYVQPSRSEGLPLALMEAASAGLPLIGTNVGGIPEVVRDTQNGILVESENAAQLADVIINLLKNSDLCVRFGEKSRAIYDDNFSLESATNHLVELYHLSPQK